MGVRVTEADSEAIKAALDRMRDRVSGIDSAYDTFMRLLKDSPLAGEQFDFASTDSKYYRYRYAHTRDERDAFVVTYTWDVDDLGLRVEIVHLYLAAEFDPRDPAIRRSVGLDEVD